ncbi:MAG TPA: VWA domain-containing protein [Pyrinomonadaceae bacterium]|jgi:VWFA-related protein|nr:VWA domain-containing protein [Pyrinomonadaceae bacterium]
MSSVKPSSPAHASKRCRPFVRAIFSCALLVVLSVPALPNLAARAQQATQETQRQRRVAEQDEDDEVLRIDTDLVMVDVTVMDAKGQVVRGLRAEDFKIYEDGEPRPVSFFNVERRGGAQRPVAVVFALDVSGSMTGEEMLRLAGALRAFAEQLKEREAVFAVMSFGMNVKIQQNFTTDTRKLERSIERLAGDVNGLSTHAYDAVDDAIRLLVRGAPRTRQNRLMKRAVVVVTDGFPVGDTVSPRTVIERANASDVSVYSVTLPSYSRLLASAEKAHSPLPTPLDVSGLVEKTGGTSIYALDKDYGPLFKALAEEVTSSYVLAFYPPEEKRRDGRTHSIRIEAPPGLHVRQSRTSYKGNDR